MVELGAATVVAALRTGEGNKASTTGSLATVSCEELSALAPGPGKLPKTGILDIVPGAGEAEWWKVFFMHTFLRCFEAAIAASQSRGNHGWSHFISLNSPVFIHRGGWFEKTPYYQERGQRGGSLYRRRPSHGPFLWTNRLCYRESELSSRRLHAQRPQPR
jgi:hypothetical protein